MKIFSYEWKKIWNRRSLLVLVLLSGLVWLAFLHPLLHSEQSLRQHGNFGVYISEMIEQYGVTLEPEELAAFDIPGKKAELRQQMDQMIQDHPIFSKHRINSFTQYQQFVDAFAEQVESMDPEEAKSFNEDLWSMREHLENHYPGQSLSELFRSPITRYQSLDALQSNFLDYHQRLKNYIEYDPRPAVISAAQAILAKQNNSLLYPHLLNYLSAYFVVVAIFNIIAVIILTLPLLITDRINQLNYLQYAAFTGRKILRVQLSAVISSGLLLSCVITFAGLALFFGRGYPSDWHTPIMKLTLSGMIMPDITLGQYGLILAGMSITLSLATVGLTFVLARYSLNIVTLLIKTIPTTLALSGIAGLAIDKAFSTDSVLFYRLFSDHVIGIELIICMALALISLLTAWMVTLREQNVDII